MKECYDVKGIWNVYVSTQGLNNAKSKCLQSWVACIERGSLAPPLDMAWDCFF